MIPATAAMSGQGNSVQGGDAGPATGTQNVMPSVGAQTFNFNAPSAGMFGAGMSGTIIKGTLAVVGIIGAIALAKQWMAKK